MATKNVTDENFETEVLKADKPTLVDFWAEWCGPCKQIAPILEEISNEMNNEIVVAKHNIDEHPNQPTKYGVRGIPTMLLFKAGELKATKVGATGVGVHTLRHSAAVSWLEAGVHIKAVADLLGHSSVAITGDVYGHTSDNTARAAAEGHLGSLGL